MFTATTRNGTLTWSRTGLHGDLDLVKAVLDTETLHVLEDLKVGPVTGPKFYPDLADPASAFLLISVALGDDIEWGGDVPELDFEVSEEALDGPNELDTPSPGDDTVGMEKHAAPIHPGTGSDQTVHSGGEYSKEYVSYDREDCSRCGGSGQYSFNQIDGTMCYGCRGKGKKLTRKANASWKKIEEFKESLLHSLIEEIKVGDRVTTHGRRNWKVEESGPDKLNPGIWTISRTLDDGTKFSYGGRVGETKIQRTPTPDEHQQIVEFARDLPGITIKMKVDKDAHHRWGIVSP
jgi:hypothetical protein